MPSGISLFWNQLCQLLAVDPWTSYFAWLSLCLLICDLEIMSPQQSFNEDEVQYCKWNVLHRGLAMMTAHQWCDFYREVTGCRQTCSIIILFLFPSLQMRELEVVE